MEKCVSYEIPQGRLKPKKKGTFGQKKPFTGNDRNHKGSKKESSGLGCKIETNRIKPKYSAKKGTKKQRVNDGTYNPLGKDKPILFPRVQYWQRVEWVQGLGGCQVCGLKKTLDHPHHPHTGASRDDRYIINICGECHNLIHRVG